MIGSTRTIGTFLWNTLRGQYTLLLTAVAAISLSLFFVPRGAELGLLNLELGFTHQALAILEENVAAGDSSAATIGALAQARAQVGDLPGAVSLLERLLGEYPRDPDLLQTLAGHYRRLGRLEESLRLVERLSTVQPSQGSLQELARLYGELNRPVEQRRVLRQLVIASRPDTADFVELAKIEKAMGNPSAGIEVLRRLEALRPAAMDTSVLALDMSLRIAANQVGSALGRAERWLARSRMPARDVLPLASVFAVEGYPAVALKLLLPLADKSHDPALVFAASQAEIDAGSREPALRRLETFAARAKDRISPELAQLRLRLAASMGMHTRAADAAKAMGIASVPMDLLAAAATASLRAERPELVAAIRTRLRNEQTALAPVFLAETSLALGERVAASEWARRAAPDAKDNPETATKLARLELSLLHRNLALAALRSGLPFMFQDGQRPVFRGNQHVPENLLGAVGRLYAELGMAAEGQMVLEVLMEKQPSPEAEQAWAMSAAMARRQDAVIEWLRTNDDKRINPDVLKELVFTAIKSGSPGLALGAAARLAQDRGTDSDRMLLAEVKVLFGAPWVRLKPSESLASAGPLNRTATR
jgi:tetratricopeptide (TPR) repeat protein